MTHDVEQLLRVFVGEVELVIETSAHSLTRQKRASYPQGRRSAPSAPCGSSRHRLGRSARSVTTGDVRHTMIAVVYSASQPSRTSRKAWPRGNVRGGWTAEGTK